MSILRRANCQRDVAEDASLVDTRTGRCYHFDEGTVIVGGGSRDWRGEIAGGPGRVSVWRNTLFTIVSAAVFSSDAFGLRVKG